MCKPSCCPGTSGSGGGLAALAVITIVILVAAARPAAHAALSVLRAALTITLITAAIVAGLALLAAAALVLRRVRCARRTVVSRPSAVIPVRPGVPVTGRTPLALTQPELARCQHAGADPEQVAQIITAVLRGLQ